VAEIHHRDSKELSSVAVGQISCIYRLNFWSPLLRKLRPTFTHFNGSKGMSDSNPSSKKFLQRLRQRVEDAPLWRALVGWGTFIHNLEKVVRPLWSAVKNPYVAPWLLAALATIGIVPATQHAPQKPPEIVAPKPPEPPKAEPPKSVAPVVPVEKPCSSISLAKIRDALTDTDTAPTAYKSFSGRQYCGWHLTVAAEPAVHTNGMWRVRFQVRDGVRVIAEMRVAPALREGDVVLVGGAIGGYLAGDAPAILLKGAWVQRR
jgi:hypothetical protein